MNRRGLLAGLCGILASGLAPAIVREPMRVRVPHTPVRWAWARERTLGFDAVPIFLDANPMVLDGGWLQLGLLQGEVGRYTDMTFVGSGIYHDPINSLQEEQNRRISRALRSLALCDAIRG